ncbi:uncharacterized protein L969DRAFT_92504 [Mixia osmundae IAM 14324]|uniref:Uncharacterized protein n=1 Tax=Mixia osmundae (strain CBS 9802 / IAM 14324 / JCM 22182 / KY 12970) TaxID=764103 RepID=G7DXC2_MIXOS|nr:uncharacterized protein L969DRAFT_92504 [Mixia osmundae IAM 14324]KEI41274.1 hypothetical protein L969DRAFT_92504 [Mixia osmundae IAM 14324]GAA95232.1 hypothetical protein E5Q_01888 [Mixia osmundae IAM 14324]
MTDRYYSRAIASLPKTGLLDPHGGNTFEGHKISVFRLTPFEKGYNTCQTYFKPCVNGKIPGTTITCTQPTYYSKPALSDMTMTLFRMCSTDGCECRQE